MRIEISFVNCFLYRYGSSSRTPRSYLPTKNPLLAKLLSPYSITYNAFSHQNTWETTLEVRLILETLRFSTTGAWTDDLSDSSDSSDSSGFSLTVQHCLTTRMSSVWFSAGQTLQAHQILWALAKKPPEPSEGCDISDPKLRFI